jgi:hypothetical protein
MPLCERAELKQNWPKDDMQWVFRKYEHNDGSYAELVATKVVEENSLYGGLKNKTSDAATKEPYGAPRQRNYL